jgi:predicted NUDIX family phosphoesterase
MPSICSGETGQAVDRLPSIGFSACEKVRAEEQRVEKGTVESATYLWVAETVLRRHRRPLTARQIVSFGLDDGLFADKDISRTPQKSMQARLSMEILRRGEASRFLRTEPGKFYLRELLRQQDTGAYAEGNLKEYTAVRRAPAPASEQVLVAPKDAYEGILDFQGINLNYGMILDRLTATGMLTHMPRTEAEVDSDFKQFITYTIIQQRDKILSFRRGQYNRAAAFLRGALCVGFGGHVTEDDYSILTYPDRGIRANAAREISEELKLGSDRPHINPDDIEVLGFLNDDSSDIGMRHVAAVLRYWAPETPEWKNPQRGEASINQLRWIKTVGPEIDLLEFEYWSQLVLRTFFQGTVISRPSFKVVRPNAFREPHVLCITGSIGSGKSITTNRLCDRAGYRQVNTGKVVAKLLGIPPVPTTPRSEFQVKAYDFITEPSGPRRLAAAILNEVTAMQEPRTIIDGVRQIETLEWLKKLSPRAVSTVFVYTPPDIAYKLYTIREADGPNLSLSDFMKIYNAPVESEVRLLIQDADAVIYNWFGLEDYEFVVEKLVTELGLGHEG